MITPKEQQLINFVHNFNNPSVAVLLAVLIVWSLVWKGTALWKAAKNGDKAWFVIMLVFNTVGILEIVYTFIFGRKKQQQQ